jgi:hypothetical protein
MKKGIAIIIFGLLVSSVEVNAKEPVVIRKDADSITFKKKALGVFKRNKYAAKHCDQHGKYASLFYGDKKDGQIIYYCQKGISDYLEKSPTSGRGRLWSNIPQEIMTKYHKTKEQAVAQKEEELAELKKIGGYKKTCSVLGFELGTDKFADCMLKLFVADNKEVQVVQSSSGVQEMIIYDPDREFRINMKKWKDRRSGKCRLSDPTCY